MPFTPTLTKLLHAVDGSFSAIILDVDCEYVQFVGPGDPYRQKLQGAYQGIVLGQVRSVHRDMDTEPPDKVITMYQNACFITQSLRCDYFLVLGLARDGNIGQGLRQIEIAGKEIDREID